MRKAFALLVLLTACSRAPAAPAGAVADAAPAKGAGTIDGPGARSLVKAGARLVDVRSPEEYAEKHVDGAENVPVDTVEGKDFGPKDAPIVVYCHSGRRSARAATTLRAAGHTRVYDLGAMSNWQ